MATKKNYSNINDKFDERLEHMLDKHNKVTFFRFDVRFPENYPHNGTNNALSRLIKLLKEPLTRNGNEMHYTWCREQKDSSNPHYHVAALVDGNHTQRVDGILKSATDIWMKITGTPNDGLIDYCNRFKGERVPRQTRIDRPSSKKNGDELIKQQQKFEAKKEDVIKRAHYLGKSNQKGAVPSRVREYGASELIKRLSKNGHGTKAE